MANKRMFTMKICDSDAFLEMPLSAQCLYFHLNMRADDDGFIGNPRKVMRIIGAAEDDLKILIGKKFLLMFDNGVLVVKHWRMHNCISKNRYHETQYLDEKNMLFLKENESYSLTEGTPIDDSHLIEQSSRQKRRDIDATQTDSDLDLDLDIEKENSVSKETLKEKATLSETSSDECTTEQLAQELKEQAEDLKCQQIVNEFNRVCTQLPKVMKLSQQRKKKIKARLKVFSEVDIYQAFMKTASSRFLSGSSGWKASFDWFFENDNNIQKVLEGNYDNSNKTKERPPDKFNNFKQRSDNLDALEKKLLGY